MTLPADIAHIRHDWARRTSDAWTTESFRAPVIAFLDSFLASHAWVEKMSIVERFLDNGVHRRVPFGPTGLADAPRTLDQGFRQSDGKPILVFRALRAVDREVFETSVPFPLGSMTSMMDLDFYLTQVRAALEASEARTPPP